MSRRVDKLRNLAIRDRLNFSFILAEYEIKLQEVLDLKKDPGLNGMRAFVSWLIHSFPDDWKDDRYFDEMDQSLRRFLVDVRPEICGYKISYKFCEKRGLPVAKVVQMYDPFKQHQAVINLWFRLGLLSRVKFKEITSGKKFRKDLEDIDLTEEDILGEMFA